MSFASPAWLLALILIPVALAAYLTARRRRRRYAVRFSGVSTLEELAATTPSWERYLPAAVVLAALAALALALARPQDTYRVPVGDTAVMLVSDESGSMAADDVSPTRLEAATQAADALVKQLPSSAALGAVAFSSAANAAQAPSHDHAAARTILDQQTANGGTNTGDALELALQLLRGSNPKHPPSAIVLLSDGSANQGPSPVTVARQAHSDHIPIYTVALGTPDGVLTEPLGQQISVPPDPQLMRQIARASGGRTFTASTSDQLGSIYTSLGQHLGTVSRKREITNEFALAGVVLLVVGGVLSVRRWGRLP
jgi:Ca-activated chloride channel family protein